MKKYALIISYVCGKCVFLTNTSDLQEAIAQFREAQKESFSSALSDKSFGLPTILSAEITNVFERHS